MPFINGSWTSYPPTANQWANTQVESDGTKKAIPNWTLLGVSDKPQPGWIVAFPRAGTSGHVGILDYDGVGIGAGTSIVSKRFEFYDTTDPDKDGATRHRKYAP